MVTPHRVFTANNVTRVAGIIEPMSMSDLLPKLQEAMGNEEDKLTQFMGECEHWGTHMRGFALRK